MAKKAKKAKVVRKTLAQQVWEAREAGIKHGHDVGWSDGVASGRREFLPPSDAREGLLSFVRAVEGWPINGDAVVAIVATDLKHICNLAVPARVMQVLATEMKKRLA